MPGAADAMPTTPVEARCRACGGDFYLFELADEHSEQCPRCHQLLSPDWTPMLLKEAADADRLQRAFMACLRHLVSFPGNLELLPHSVLRNLFEEVGWEQDLAADRALANPEIAQLPPS